MSYTLPPNHRYRVSNAEFEATLQKVAKRIQEAKGAWLRSCMENVLPPEIFALAYTGKVKDKRKVSRYMDECFIRLKEFPDRTQLVMGKEGEEEIIGEFRVVMKNGKLTPMGRIVKSKNA